MRTDGPSAHDGLLNESEQNMIDTLEDMKITSKKQQQIQRTFNSIHDRHAFIIGCFVCGIRCILPRVTAEGALIPPPVLKVFPTDPMFGPLKIDDEEMREWHLLDPIKQKVMSSKLSESDGNRYHVHQDLINLIQVMDGGDDFSLITKGYICTNCENYLSQKKLPMYSVAMIDFGLMSRHIPEQLHPIELLLLARHWPLAITLKLSHKGLGPDVMIGHCISFAH